MTEPESQLPDATPNLVRPPRLSRLRRLFLRHVPLSIAAIMVLGPLLFGAGDRISGSHRGYFSRLVALLAPVV